MGTQRQPTGEPGDARAVLPPAAFKQGRGTAVAEEKREEIPLFATISGSARMLREARVAASGAAAVPFINLRS